MAQLHPIALSPCFASADRILQFVCYGYFRAKQLEAVLVPL